MSVPDTTVMKLAHGCAIGSRSPRALEVPVAVLPKAADALRPALAVVVGLLFSASSLVAQPSARRATILVRDSANLPLAAATVEVEVDETQVRMSRVADEDGRVTVLLPTFVRATIGARRIGYGPAQIAAEASDTSSTYRVTLHRTGPPLLARVRVTATRSVSGYVVSASTQLPLRGAIVSMSGTSGESITDSTGAFYLKPGRARSLVLLTRAKGYRSQVRVDRVKVGESRELLFALVSDSMQTNLNRNAQFDMERRVTWRGASSALVSGKELRATGAAGLLEAILLSPSTGDIGLRASNSMCVFVDGEPRPGQTVESFPTDRVRFVELYDANADRLRDLEDRWPKFGPCGLSNLSTHEPGAVRWIVIWTAM